MWIDAFWFDWGYKTLFIIIPEDCRTWYNDTEILLNKLENNDAA